MSISHILDCDTCRSLGCGYNYGSRSYVPTQLVYGMHLCRCLGYRLQCALMSHTVHSSTDGVFARSTQGSVSTHTRPVHVSAQTVCTVDGHDACGKPSKKSLFNTKSIE